MLVFVQEAIKIGHIHLIKPHSILRTPFQGKNFIHLHNNGIIGKAILQTGIVTFRENNLEWKMISTC